MSTKLRYFEYYDMQSTFDWLFQRSLNNQMKGVNLYKIIVSDRNILLAYRMIKSNTGSNTAGVDNKTISEFKIKEKSQFIKEIRKELHCYKPNPIRRVEIPKENGKTRPLGIPTIKDRIIQQMFKQVLEPICEAKFYRHSYGFRPNRSVQHAMARSMFLINRSKLHYVVDVDIKGFFDNVNHTKLLSQLYTIGVKDRRVLAIIGKMLKAPIAGIGVPNKGTPQGGILSPLLSNVVLNDLDQWIASQWEEFPTKHKYSMNGDKYSALRRTSKLKEMYIVRYADDFKIFSNDYKKAWKIFHAVKGYINNHLKLEISPEKSKVTNLRKRSSEFLGFSIRVIPKKHKYVAKTNVSRKNKKRIKQSAKERIKKIQANPTWQNIMDYNSFVLGVHQYFAIATHVNIDFAEIAYALLITTYNRLRTKGAYEVPRSPPYVYRKFYRNRYKTFKIGKHYLYPLRDIQWKMLRNFTQEICDYTAIGREYLYKPLNSSIGTELQELVNSTLVVSNLEYADNRISKYSMQRGKCAITGRFLTAPEVYCHHIIPRALGGTDEFKNLVVIHEWAHILIHATQKETIERYVCLLELSEKQIQKVNDYRRKCNLAGIY